ncbi:uncharacterized protein LOC105073055 isoform X1 [Camelus bactrianus]|uniref:Uncharacterized protein LOC105073055 isoform X3 n=1 Tax=Camelus bactrianus TaxID=9837 RepID=A0A9W3EWR9_CAMBA|nr:uncharacterized protein LOC105073055 isoform X3 [Camelus bactrianus]XP_031319223.1 uncharacterized protein LOC105091983 isoform X1 [Camelus dromedarius]XP_045376560.1 uncharacterized protein LOC105073055 isoform X3 [Camelus bactrianus]
MAPGLPWRWPGSSAAFLQQLFSFSPLTNSFEVRSRCESAFLAFGFSTLLTQPREPIGETLRPVWGQMDKCYPVTTQRHRVKNGKKQDSEAMTPKTTGGPNDAAPKEETDVLSQDEGEVRSPGEEAASPIPAGQEVAEEEAVSVPPGGEETKKARKEIAVYTSEASEVDIKEETPEGWVPQLLRKLWLGWFPASDFPKTQNRE